MITIGCDQHKKYSYAVAKDDQNTIVSQAKLYHADKEEMRAFFGGFPSGTVVALEACGFDHWLGDLLEEMGLTVKLAHTAKTKAIAEERIKTDKISAHVLADLVRWDLLPQAYRAPRPVRDARTYMRYRMRLIGVRSGFKNKIHSILDYQGIQQDFSDLYGTDGRRFLDQLALPAPYQSIVKDYLSLIDQLTMRINRIDAQLRKQVKADSQALRLKTIPGIGFITAATILAEVGDIHRFPNAHKLARYVGIVPSMHQSGQVLYRGRITKQGNKYLRTAFVESAQTAIRRDPYLKTHFDRLKAKKGYGVAIVAVAHKLLKSAYAVLTKREDYRYRPI